MPEAIIAIDPGTSTGVAFQRADGSIAWRTWELPGTEGARVNALLDRLAMIQAAEGFRRVGYEAPYCGRNFVAVRVLVQYETAILAWAARLGLPIEGYRPPGQHTAFACYFLPRKRVCALPTHKCG